MELQPYWRKRDYKRAPEPQGHTAPNGRHRFVVQEHNASRWHLDFRLEMGGVLKSWAVPKGPSLDPGQKRLAVRVEDHPVEHLDMEPEAQDGANGHGANDVLVWDAGEYVLHQPGDPLQQLEAGQLSFRLDGQKMSGAFALVKLHGYGRENQWLLIKSRDEQDCRDGNGAQPIQPAALAYRAAHNGTHGGAPARTAPRRKTPAAKAEAARQPERAPRTPAAQAFARRQMGGDAALAIGRDVVALTHLDRVYWPGEGYSKFDLLRYYWQIADALLPHLKDRPLILKRYPSGVDQASFFQHDVNTQDLPPFVRTVASRTEDGRQIDYVLCQNRATLLYLANMGTLAMNPWHSRAGRLDCPDWVVFDLDPGEVGFEAVCDTALAVKSALDRLGLQAWPKTSGSRGLHIHVPLKPGVPYDQAAEFAERVARLVAREHSGIATVERVKKKRPAGAVYVDFLQNARGKSVVAPYSVRARPGATVAAPLDWAEVRRCPDLAKFTLKTMPRRLAQKGDLFKPVLAGRQRLDEALERLEELESG
jgi:bifunctional non-homologous end joining protein LigD